MMMFFKVNSHPNTCTSDNNRCNGNNIHSEFVGKHVQFLTKKYPVAMFLKPSAKNLTCSFSVNTNQTFTKGFRHVF